MIRYTREAMVAGVSDDLSTVELVYTDEQGGEGDVELQVGTRPSHPCAHTHSSYCSAFMIYKAVPSDIKGGGGGSEWPHQSM